MADFTFRQFSVSQDRCAMKVGTDGVLLGAWARGGNRVLDIGTGTGIVALMMAQRFDQARVTALEIDAQAAGQARENVAGSPFADRIEVVCASLQDFAAQYEGPAFNAIVCNPPYFVNSLKNVDKRSAMARHTESLPFSLLMKLSRILLSPDGTASYVIAAEAKPLLEAEAAICGLRATRQYDIQTTQRKPVKRFLLEFAKWTEQPFEHQKVTLMEGGKRSEWYRELTKNFYIK